MSDETAAGEGRAVPGETPDDAIGATSDSVRSESGSSELGEGIESGFQGPAGSSKFTDDLSDMSEMPQDGDRESALVGASPAGSARAAARRSGVRAGATVAKGAATRSRDVPTVSRGSLFARLQRFLREVVAELRKVIWPARNQMITYTIVVIVFVVFMVALTAGLDVLFAKGVLTVFG